MSSSQEVVTAVMSCSQKVVTDVMSSNQEVVTDVHLQYRFPYHGNRAASAAAAEPLL